jgi:sugar O-acyltransferase (sialic acid O-acetyltransferase NeuD family)
MRKLVIIGAGDMIGNLVESFDREPQLAYIHDEPRTPGETKYGVPVEKRPAILNYDYISCIGDTRHKRNLVQELDGASFINFIDPLAKRLRSSKLGAGIFAQPFAVVWNGAEVEDHVLILSGCQIGHHVHVGKYSTICPGAVISGHDDVGEGVWVGANSSIRDGLKIGDGAFIGIGANIIEDIAPNEVWVGNPAHKLKMLAPW